MKLIPLSQGKFAKVDDEDYDYLNQWVWHAHEDGLTHYARRHYLRDDGTWSALRMHRLIMNAPEKMEVDHIDSDGLNNQKSNLRLCTRAQNNMHRRCWNKCGFTGISIARDGKFVGRIKINKESYYLGRDYDINIIVRRYDMVAKWLHGEFAILNFPDE